MVSNSLKKRNNQPYRHLLVKLGAVALFLVLAALVVVDVKIYQKKKEFNAQIASLQNKVQALKDQNEKLKESTVRAGDDAYIEKVAREELDLQIPGEKVISFVDAKDGAPKNEGVSNNDVTGWIGNAWNALISVFKK